MLKMILDNETDIPAGLEGHYAERDGKWELQVDGAKSQTDIDKLKAALDAERVLKREADKKAASAVELQAELDGKNAIIATFKDKGFDENSLNQMAEERAADKIRVATMERDQIQAKLEETKGSLTAMQQQVNQSKIRAALRKEMKGSVRESAQEIFLQLHEKKFTLVDGIVLTSEDVYGKTISAAEFVKGEVAAAPDIFGPTSSGGGATGGKKGAATGGENPFKGKGNLTLAAALARDDPAAAKAAIKAAGLTAHDKRFGAIIKSLG